MIAKTIDHTTQIINALALLHEPGQVFEIRILDAPKGNNGYRVTMAGYFDNYEAAARAITPYNGKANIYTTLNPCDPALLARTCNRLAEQGKGDVLTADKNIIKRRWLPLDFDYSRPAKISSTQEELEAARALAREVQAYLSEWGWPAPIEADSGNGAHRLYRVDLPNDEESKNLFESVLKHLSEKFTASVKVDETVFNAARIWKVYGTIAVKGDNIPTRPHRLATIQEVPPALEIVTPALLDTTFAPPPVAPVVSPTPVYRNGTGYTESEIESALTKLGASYHKKNEPGRVIYALDRCLASDAHTDGACVTLETGGKAGYKCHHDSCKAKDWQTIKPLLFPDRQKSRQADKPGHDDLRDRWLDKQPLTAFGLGDWQRYNAGIWQPVSDLEIKASVTKVIEAAKFEGIKVTSSVVSSVTELIKFEIARPDSIWDSESRYLVCGNGTLHIPTRALAGHRPEIYATSGVSYDYNPAAKAPAFEHFLGNLAKSTVGDVVSFLQEFAGYALTTDTSHELSIWLFGPPGSGKSTFLAGLETMLGNRAGILGLADIASNRFALANLPGKTLAISTEQPGDYIASTHILNSIISGETITVDRKFRDAIQVTPRCKLAWAMNELPRVSDPNSGLFRRVKVVEFPVIPESQRDPQLKQDIKNEGAGILNWALDGLERLRNRGRFEIPPEIREAAESFKNNNDIPARFVEDCCFTGNDQKGDPYRVSGSQLYEAYKQWCVTTGHKPQSSTSVATDWRRLGFEKYLAGGKAFWRFVGLKE